MSGGGVRVFVRLVAGLVLLSWATCTVADPPGGEIVPQQRLDTGRLRCVPPETVDGQPNSAALLWRAYDQVGLELRQRVLDAPNTGKAVVSIREAGRRLPGLPGIIECVRDAAFTPVCDWGTPREFIPRDEELEYRGVAELSVKLLVADARSQREAGAPEEAAVSLEASIRLVRHLASDRTLMASVSACGLLQHVAGEARAFLSDELSTGAHAGQLREALDLFSAEDPFEVEAALRELPDRLIWESARIGLRRGRQQRGAQPLTPAEERRWVSEFITTPANAHLINADRDSLVVFIDDCLTRWRAPDSVATFNRWAEPGGAEKLPPVVRGEAKLMGQRRAIVLGGEAALTGIRTACNSKQTRRDR